MNSFGRDLQYSNNEMPPIVRFFRRLAKGRQAIYVRGEGKYATKVQQEDHVDIVANSFLSFFEDFVSIEVKIRSIRYANCDDLLVETRSCSIPGFESSGWIYTCKADLLCYVNILTAHLKRLHIVDMPGLQEWFCDLERDIERGDKQGYKPIYTSQSNRTESFPIPWDDIPAELILYNGVIHPDGNEVFCDYQKVPEKKPNSQIDIQIANLKLWEVAI